MNADASVTVVFQDEVHYQVQTSVTAKWVPKGSKPKVMSKPGKQNVAYSGYLIPDTGELIVNKPSWFNYETVIQSFRDFIAAVSSKNNGKYCMILDNAPWHKKAIRLIWIEELPEYQDIREKMTYLNLPPYSPDLNPIHYYPTKESLEAALDEYYSNFRKPNAKLSALCSFKSFRKDASTNVA